VHLGAGLLLSAGRLRLRHLVVHFYLLVAALDAATFELSQQALGILFRTHSELCLSFVSGEATLDD